MQVKRSLLAVLAIGLPVSGWLAVAQIGPVWLRGALLAGLLLALPVFALGRVRDDRDARPWLLPLSAGMALFPLGHLVKATGEYAAASSAPLMGDLLVLVAYPFLLGGLLAALAQHVRGIRLSVCLDGLAGALAGGAVATLAVAPLMPRLPADGWATVPVLILPLLDAVLVSAALGAVALVGRTHGRQFGVWALAMVTLGAAHIGQAHPFAVGTEPPAWSGALVVLALCLLALGALGHGAARPDRVPRPRSLGVPATASVAAVVVLAAAPAWQQAALPSVLSLLTLVVAAARFVRAFLQLRELAAVKELALTDELTGIANRRALYVHLDALLALDDSDPAGATVDDAGTFAVALVDLDHFKEVNDALGHATGDALLRGVVARFSRALEQLETPYLFARLGGDEFAVVLHEATTRNAALVVGEALQESLAEPLLLPGAELHAHASIGLAAAPLHGRTRSEILFAADAAMYAAKASGDSVRFHAPSRDEKSQELTIAEDLHRALDRRELVVAYQPIVSAAGEMVAVEALLRWEHPEKGTLLPGDFLGAAERYRLTGAIAARVLEVALVDLMRWRAEGVDLGLTVNVSATDLRDEAIVSTVAAALLEHELPPDALTLDIPETALVRDMDRVTDVLLALHGLGVSLALDDYGTGGTSLTRLGELPFGSFKLDGRFARDADVDSRSTGVVKAAVDLAHALGKVIVAEGVEDRRAHARLCELGCDLLQGWELGRPGTVADIEARLVRPTAGKHRLTVQAPAHPDGAPRVTPE